MRVRGRREGGSEEGWRVRVRKGEDGREGVGEGEGGGRGEGGERVEGGEGRGRGAGRTADGMVIVLVRTQVSTS